MLWKKHGAVSVAWPLRGPLTQVTERATSLDVVRGRSAARAACHRPKSGGVFRRAIGGHEPSSVELGRDLGHKLGDHFPETRRVLGPGDMPGASQSDPLDVG
ncbi:hypothetical protein GCM10009687_73000 [Asanoa iriomotensis]|uniref:Uncharacterized protein n=1 Tax=Asanoa iriomotensis TaxID=234613 RepID=A0ABQ4BVZ8_9ACTN|nr:hypothetical protein Air01nite_08090 [Asanoa iriomotensis]